VLAGATDDLLKIIKASMVCSNVDKSAVTYKARDLMIV
jgi:hypothetical protein